MTHSVPTRRSSDLDAQQTGFVDRGLQRLKLAVYKRRWKEMRGAASRHAGFGHVATYVQPDEAQPLHVLTQLRAVNQFQGRATEQDTLVGIQRSEEHTSELQSLMRNSYAVFCLQKKKPITK